MHFPHPWHLVHDFFLKHRKYLLPLLACWMPPAFELPAQDKTLIDFQSQQVMDTYFSEGVAVGDIDGDDVNDLVYGPFWLAGPEFAEKHEIYPAKPQPMEAYADNFFAWVYDFDGDQANDIFVVGFPGTPAYVYRNPGKGVGVWEKHQVFDWVSNESPHFVNIVGDERPELVCTRDGFFGFATIDWTNPLQPWAFHAVSEKSADARFGHGLGVGDINGDGLIDLLHAGGWFEQPSKNALNGRWTSHAAKFTQAYGGAEMHAYDVDGDGDSDVITSEAAHDFGLSWYEQTQNADGEIAFTQHLIMGNHPSQNTYGLVFSELHSVNLADINGDGLKDILTGKTYYSHHKQSPMWDAGPVVYWFELNRTEAGVDWIPHLVNSTSGIGRQLVVADINQDGLLDVATGGMLGASVSLQQRSSVSAEEFAAAQPKKHDAPAVVEVVEAVTLRGPRSPIAADGKVAEAIEGEELNVQVSGGSASAQPMGGFPGDVWSGGSQLWWTGAQPGDALTLELNAFKDIEALEIAMTCAVDYAIVQLELDGRALGEPIDLFNSEVITTGLLEFKTPGLTQGKHELKVLILGANKKAVKRYMFGLDYLRFRGVGQQFPLPDSGSKPTSSDGRVLNLDFEDGTLGDWTATGNAFDGQPVRGDVVSARRSDSRSQHIGEFWIGGYELAGDAPKGTLTSAPFVVNDRYASFRLGGGDASRVRLELWETGATKPFYSMAGRNIENMDLVVADLSRQLDKQITIRLVDDSSAGWGHINFDHFRLHAEAPAPVTPTTTVLVNDEYPHSGLEAEAAAAAMQVPEGFHVTVCAAEPDIKQPIAFAMDDRGRTWVAEAYEYPQRAKGDKGRDRILIFEDTTGDGKFDSRKVFAEGLNLVSGLEVGFGGVWVGAAPYLLFIPDKDGDDKADGDPQILLDGWGYQDTHETLNAFCWGPDGWLYGCHGVFTHSRVGKPGTTDADRTPINAGVWRYHPLRHQFEVFAHGTSNPWGVDFNDHGEAFVTACVIPHLYHIIPGARYQRQAGEHFNPYTFADIPTIADHLHYLGATPHSGNGKSDEAGGGHAHAGAMFYQGGVWPAQYHDVLFMNNIHGQRLNTDILEPAGSGYVGHHGPDFLLTGDQASQILNMRYGPDGHVTMIDWYDMQACHRNEVEVHDRSNGRIYKISYGKPRSAKVNVAAMSDSELAEQCLNANNWFVRHARRVLQERSAKGSIAGEAVARLTEIATLHSDDTRRLRAAWALHAAGLLSNETINAMLRDSSPHVRGWAIRLMLENQQYRASVSQLKQLAEMARSEESQIVRLALCSAVGRLPLEERWDILVGLVSHLADADDHNLPLMIWYAMEPLAEVDPDRALALGMQAGHNIPLLRNFMLRRVAGSGDSKAVERLVRALAKSEEAPVQLAFLDAIRSALAGQRQTKAPAEWANVFAALLGSDNEQIRLEATALGVTFGDARALEQLKKNLTNNSLPEADRVASLESLLDAKADGLARELLTLIANDSSGPLTLAAIRGLAQYDAPEIAPTLIELYDKLGIEERRAAIATMASRKSSAIALLNAIGNAQIASVDLSADLARQMEYLGDEQITSLLKEHWGLVRATSAEREELAQKYRQLVSRTDLPEPDLPLGRAIFAKTCQRCHQLYGIGQNLGPDLTGSNRANLDYLLENIVDPSAVMAKEYRQSIILTDSGQVITGIVRSENERAVSIQTAEKLVVVPKNEIETMRASEQSMMPEDQLSQFSEHEIRSLIAYLRNKSQTPMLATTENAGTLFDGKSLAGWSGNDSLWSVNNGEIVGLSTGLDQNEFLISDLQASDFVLTLEIKLVNNEGNSGIQFRSAPYDGGSVAGYQADVGIGWWGKLYEEHGRALLWDKSGEEHVKVGEWNTYVIEAVGSQIRTSINGQMCVDLSDPDGRKSGVFAIQLHSGGPTEVRVRNIRLEVK